MLFLYNLASIGSELGFVDADDWPGDRLGWIFQEMVRKDWEPPSTDRDRAPSTEATMDSEQRPCIKGCGRPAAAGGFDTCCRGCGSGGAHDAECDEREKNRRQEEKKEEKQAKDAYEGGETQDWNVGGWIVLAMYNVTVCLLLLLAVVIPMLTAYTPFNKIVPELIDNS